MFDKPDFREKSYLSLDDNAQTQSACLNRIYQTVDRLGLSTEALQELQEDIAYVADCYDIEPPAAVLLAAILEKTNTHNGIDDEDLAQYLGCSNIEFIQYHKHLNSMGRLGIIQISNNHRRCYRASQEIFKAIEKNCEFVPVKMTGLTPNEFFLRVKKFFNDYRGGGIMDTSDDELVDNLDTLVKDNGHLAFCRKVLDSSLYTNCSNTERRMFFFICFNYVIQGKSSVSVDILMNFSELMEDEGYLKRMIAAGETGLQKGDLVSFAIEDGFVNSDALSVSDTVKQEFLFEVEIAPEEQVRHKDMISAESIKPKELFYNHEESVQIKRLENLLKENTFKEVQDRLTATGMRKGFNVILYGAPGTGKTACVYELARKTGRDIFAIDMSKLRSKWVGDSEKTIKSVFWLYRGMCRTNPKAPILLFNEADAIFSKRLENIEHSADQMNNTIQNIILQEMEDLDGILIATTNLLNNLDAAFERRFLFKVEFKTPDKESRARIWKSMIAGLPDADADTLAERYTFSGGNIENVARKSSVEYVLSGKKPDLATLDAFCKEELLNRNNTVSRIGFKTW